MMNWLNRGEQEKQRRKRRWQILGMLLIGVAVAVYWFDRRTSNAFEHAPNLNLRQTSPERQSTPSAERTASQAATSATANVGGASEPAQAGAALGATESSSFSDDVPEPNTAEEDEKIVQGETGQLAASPQPGRSAETDDSATSGDVGATADSAEQLAETGPVPTITGGLVEGDGTHDCPDGYPIKGNASSRIYHLPGESSYDVTVPEVCFATEQDAAAAGYRPRKH
jgi:cytoskeletal protein RodZ